MVSPAPSPPLFGLLLLALSLLAACANEAEPCGGTCPPEACINEACIAATCSADDPCSAGDWCDPRYDRCREGCASDDALCADGRVCDGASNTCSECSDDNPCPSGRCEAGRCVECSQDAECGLGLGLYCRDGVCAEGCLRDEHCPTSTVCEATQQRCVDCRRDEDCGPDQTCDVDNRTCR